MLRPDPAPLPRTGLLPSLISWKSQGGKSLGGKPFGWDPGRQRGGRRRGSLATSLLAALLGSVLTLPGAEGQDTAPSEGPSPIRRLPGAPEWPDDFETGLRAAFAFSEHFGLVETDSLLLRVNDIGYRVASQAGRREILFSFHILDLPEPNALALPGGFVFITRGMLDLRLGDAELAHLLGHEVAHVTERHFSRADRVGGILSLLQTAALVAALVAIPSGQSGGVDLDPETGRYRTSLGGKEAAVQGTAIFGGLFRELLVRGYSRGLEMEADEIGRRFAGRAGYPMLGGVRLMEELHERIYEDQEYGYWRTHPYFTDRVARARAAVDAGGSAPPPPEVRAYRVRVSDRLSEIATSIEDDAPALFLHRAALSAAPDGEPSIAVEHKMLQKRAERLRRQKEVLRAYGPLIADYDTLLTRIEATAPQGGSGLAPAAPADSSQLQRIRSEREDLVKERADIYRPSLEILERKEAGVQFLELFVENFPQDSLAPRIHYRLAEQYRLSDRADEAALALNDLLRETPDDPEADQRVLSSLRDVLPQTQELTTSHRILSDTPSDSARAWAHWQLQELAADLDSLEVGSRYLETVPTSDIGPAVRERVEILAMKRYYQARLYESLRRYQEALDQYNRLILLAPSSEAARLAREGIARVQAIAGR